ncbi:hypothetical protein KC328_g54 [Hortaea werneckii]|nr:hypothetical protein KC328_g54 [Hortaea werneckii]
MPSHPKVHRWRRDGGQRSEIILLLLNACTEAVLQFCTGNSGQQGLCVIHHEKKAEVCEHCGSKLRLSFLADGASKGSLPYSQQRSPLCYTCSSSDRARRTRVEVVIEVLNTSNARSLAAALAWLVLLWARNDSSPLLNANDPKGRAESESNNKEWSVEADILCSLRWCEVSNDGLLRMAVVTTRPIRSRRQSRKGNCPLAVPSTATCVTPLTNTIDYGNHNTHL